MNEPIVLRSVSMADYFRQKLRKQGYDEINPNLFIFARDEDRVVWRYTGDAWEQSIEMVCGVKVLDEES